MKRNSRSFVNAKRQKHSQKSDEGCVPSSQESHPSSSPPCEDCCIAVEDGYEAKHQLCHETML